MNISSVIYNGDLRTTARHIRSGNEIFTDAPVDNEGKGEAFSPTDLVSTMLASCMLTIIGIAANKHGFSIDGTRAEISKTMYNDPRRIGEIAVHFRLPRSYSAKEKRIIEAAAKSCPVAQSLNPEIRQNIHFEYA